MRDIFVSLTITSTTLINTRCLTVSGSFGFGDKSKSEKF